MVIAKVTTTTTINGEVVTEEKVIEGAEAEVKAKLEALEKNGAEIKVNIEKTVKKVVEEVEEN
jgi:K(+)-stimulated pyrophosphate-energized sodium pump